MKKKAQKTYKMMLLMLKKYLKNKFIFSALLLFLKIVNNSNILTDGSGTREKNCLERDL